MGHLWFQWMSPFSCGVCLVFRLLPLCLYRGSADSTGSAVLQRGLLPPFLRNLHGHLHDCIKRFKFLESLGMFIELVKAKSS